MNGFDTIFALSSGALPAAIAIIRVSGPAAFATVEALTGPLPPERVLALRRIVDPVTKEWLDEALVVRFPAARSVTGEDLVELHCHGGRAVVAAVLAVFEGCRGCRSAQPGEFTRRALENGKYDLNVAEGLADLLQAETESQRRAAMAMYGGGFSRVVAHTQDRLLHIAGQVEAALDFDDEDDVGAGTLAVALVALATLQDDLDAELAAPPAERLRDGVRVVIAGPVNAGKSTLFNALVGADAAIVSDIAGTTRDRIEMPVQIGGVAYLMTDTAGLRADGDADPIERIGMERARQAGDAADILLWLGDADQCPRDDAILVRARADERDDDDEMGVPHNALVLSAHTGLGMAELRSTLDHRARALLPTLSGYALSARQRGCLREVTAEIRAARQCTDPLLLAEHVRLARLAVDRLTGRASTEDMLDRLFAGFCIGK